jgi:hypothetical protein
MINLKPGTIIDLNERIFDPVVFVCQPESDTIIEVDEEDKD